MLCVSLVTSRSEAIHYIPLVSYMIYMIPDYTLDDEDGLESRCRRGVEWKEGDWAVSGS